MQPAEIMDWLLEEDASRLEELWRLADQARLAEVGDEVHLRGLIEISSHCRRQCHYCGLRAGNSAIDRYRMSADEILQCARQAREFGYGTVVLQAGEDAAIKGDWIADLVGRIKRIPPAAATDQPLAVTLSLGERSDEELALWRNAGADRYLLRFETSNPALFERIHPPEFRKACNEDNPQSSFRNPQLDHPRLGILRRLRALGYEVGSGVMIGIPGQTYSDLANDVAAFAGLDLDMIGMGPYLPHPQTPLGRTDALRNAECGMRIKQQQPSDPTNGGKPVIKGNPQSEIRNPQSQPPNSELMTYKMIALARLACPRSNIPATTALASINKDSGRELGLMRGANIVMPNLTPTRYRAMYEIYPAKACIYETAEQCHGCLSSRIHSIGRRAGGGRGDSPNRRSRSDT